MLLFAYLTIHFRIFYFLVEILEIEAFTLTFCYSLWKTLQSNEFFGFGNKTIVQTTIKIVQIHVYLRFSDSIHSRLYIFFIIFAYK